MKIKQKMISNIAISSTKCYQRCWESFINFVKSRKKTTKKFSVVMVYRFFNFLILKGYKYQTLLTYRCAIKRPIKSLLHNYCIETDENLKNLLLYAKTNCKKKCDVKLWDLDKVISFVNYVKILT